MFRKPKDWIALVEAGYDLEGTEQDWLERVLARAAPLFDRGMWPGIVCYRYTPTTVQIENVAVRGPARIVSMVHESTKATSEAVDLVFRSGISVATMSETVFSRLPSEQATMRRITGGLMRDILGIKAHTATGRAIMLTLPMLRTSKATAVERRRWSRVVSHLGAGLRLRAAARSLSCEMPAVEAILEPGGRLREARAEATHQSVRSVLRETVRRIERVRSRAGRADPDGALRAWDGLVRGRWSMIDRFDSDGRRFVVAMRNDPAHPDPRGLTARERQVAEYVGLGRTNKEICYTLGVSQSAVTNCTARAQEKLGLSSRAELTAFYSPTGMRAKLAEVSVAGEYVVVGAYPLINEERISVLTGAERAVLAHLVAGSTNGDIARRRKTSERTVANQVQSIYCKLKVRSRSELASCLQQVH